VGTNLMVVLEEQKGKHIPINCTEGRAIPQKDFAGFSQPERVS